MAEPERVMTPHPCDWTAGELLALGAIASTSRAAGGPRLSDKCFEHVKQHQTPTTEGDLR
ncbi:MAG: hypothetical protein HZY73_11180 [Micropruina sp.]|nr:MAG: hypothetical protein HZY73_11180 [Micropruina sp.]